MSTRTVALVGGGAFALVAGAAVAAVGFYFFLQTPCTGGYVVAVQPADEVADPPETTVAYANLTDHQRSAFEAGLAGDDRTFGPRESLARLDGAVVVYGGDGTQSSDGASGATASREGERYVTELRPDRCRNPEKWVVYGGGTLSVVGFFAALLGVVRYVYL